MELRKQEAKLRQTMEDMTTRYARLKSFEWRYEFPEILDDNGRFLGFDCIIGNPPYGVSIQGEYRKTVEEKLKHVPDYEIYYFFISLGRNLLRDNGYLAYIIPNTWLFNQFAQSYRESLVEIDASKNYVWNIKELLDCTNIPIFEAATVRNVLVIMQKAMSPLAAYAIRTRVRFLEETAVRKRAGACSLIWWKEIRYPWTFMMSRKIFLRIGDWLFPSRRKKTYF